MALALVASVMLATPVMAQQEPPPVDDSKRGCRRDPAACGTPVVISDDVAKEGVVVGPSGCEQADSGCRMDQPDSGASDYVPPGATIRRGEDGRAEIADGGGGSPGAAVGCAFVPPSRVAPDLGQVALPDDGRLHTNPDHGDTHGVSGMESWFWWTGTAEVSWVSPVLPGVATDCALLPAPEPVTYRARITRWRYDVADSVPGRYVATAPGVAVDPLRPDGGEVAARHTYHTKGRWPAQVTCTWTVEGTGGVARPCGRRDLHVIEIRAASAAPGPRG